MIRIIRLKQPNRRSGKPVGPGETINLKNVSITNKNKFIVYVDAFSRKPWKPAAKTVGTKKVKKAAPTKKSSKKQSGKSAAAVDAASL